MDTSDVFTIKAEKYARYRWDYARQAIEALINATHISQESSVADIGAGTGILTKHFVGRVKQIYAVEPNHAMRQMAIRTLGNLPGCQIIDGRAEATNLADHSIDLLIVGTAFNWFDPQPTRAEFLRILKPGGWVANFHNYGIDQALGEAISNTYPKETTTEPIMKGKETPVSYYFGGDDYERQTFAFTCQETWEEFFGSLATASFAPEEDSPQYADFKHAVRKVFDSFCQDGLVLMRGETEVIFGHIAPA